MSRTAGPREIARAYYGALRMRLLGYVNERWMASGECGSLAADELIAVLLDQRSDWAYRAWSAMLLASSNEKATTEALSHAFQRDPVYWVRRDALRSLQLLIGNLAYETCPA